MALECSLVVNDALDAAGMLRRLPGFDEHEQSLTCARGFELMAVARENGYFEAQTDAGMWTWEPARYVSVKFRIDKFFDRKMAWNNVLAAVAEVLKAGPEDAALLLGGDVLLLRRQGGVLQRTYAAFWSALDEADLPSGLA